jgi:hypothetical protein
MARRLLNNKKTFRSTLSITTVQQTNIIAMNKKKTYIAPAILSTIVCPDLNILAGSVESATGNCQFRDLDDNNEADGDAFYSREHIIDVWE